MGWMRRREGGGRGGGGGGVFFFKQKTAYEIGTGDWSSDVCSSDLRFWVREVARNIMNDMEDDTLRVMVTEIIREELAGELGEKITRNVRKLVRREINRAFMARGLD